MKPNNPPAFAMCNELGEIQQVGMTLRDYLAAKAMQGIISNADTMREITRECQKNANEKHFFKIIATYSYVYADAMLAEREKTNE